MVESGNKGINRERHRIGTGKCCCALSTLVIIAALGVVAFLYREIIVEEWNDFRSEGSENVDETDSSTDFNVDEEYPTDYTDRYPSEYDETTMDETSIDDSTTIDAEYSGEQESTVSDYEDYEIESTTRGEENFSRRVPIDYETANDSDEEDLTDLDDSISDTEKYLSELENKINQKKILSNITDIYQSFFNETKNDSNELIKELQSLFEFTTSAPVTTTILYDGSGSGGHGFKKKSEYGDDEYGDDVEVYDDVDD